MTLSRMNSLLLSMLFGLLFVSPQEDVSAWKEVKNENGIIVSTRDNSLSNLKEVKATVVVESSLSTLVFLIKDAKSQPEWAYKIIKAKEVKSFNNFHWVAYTVTEMPWPITNRDDVTDCRLTQYNDSSIFIMCKTVDGYVDKNEDCIRIPFIRTSWRFIPLESGKVKVVFQLLLKMGGSTPDWVANLFIDEGPYKTINNLKNIAKKDKYKNVKLDYIKE